MKRVVLVFALTVLGAAACGGSSKNSKVEEVPIENGGGGGSSLPPDEVGDGSAATTTVVIPDGSAPPGVGPQSLDTQPQSDAGGPTAVTPTFQQRTGGLTQKECTDMVALFAKLSTKESHGTAPSATDLPKDPIYGQMIADCGQSTSKKQKTCAMAARTSAGWKKCME
jgi:hypothetical protein